MNEYSAEGVVGLWAVIASAIRLYNFFFSKTTFEARKRLTKHKFKTMMLLLAAELN